MGLRLRVGMTGDVNNWGTKWDVVDVQFTQSLLIVTTMTRTLHLCSNRNASFSFNCWTAWSPPIPVWDVLVEHGFQSVDADYQDEGMGFEGTLCKRRGQDVGSLTSKMMKRMKKMHKISILWGECPRRWTGGYYISALILRRNLDAFDLGHELRWTVGLVTTTTVSRGFCLS